MKRIASYGMAGALALLLAWFGGAAPARGEVTAGAGIVMDASLDDDGNNRWENIADAPANAEGLLDTAGGVARVAVSGAAGGITAAYEFPGGTAGANGAHFVTPGTTSTIGFGNLGWATSPVSLEIWFKPDPSATYTANGDVLFETGGGTGLGVFYNDGLLQIGRNSTQVISHDVSALAGDFIQAVLTFNSTSGGAMVLYVNGEQAATGSTTTGSWCGGDAGALAARGGSNVGGRGSGDQNTRSFHGQMAIFRGYRNRILTAGEVLANYETVMNPPIFSDLTASAITTDSALLGATLEEAVSAATLVWDTTDKGTDSTGHWIGNLDLGALAAGPVSGTAAGLDADTLYSFRFFAEPDQRSAAATFPTALTAAQTPEFTSAEFTVNGNISLTWQDKADTETGYVLQRSESGSGGPYVIVATLPANSTAHVDKVAPLTTYHYRLAAVNADNGSSTDPAACETSGITTPEAPAVMTYTWTQGGVVTQLTDPANWDANGVIPNGDVNAALVISAAGSGNVGTGGTPLAGSTTIGSITHNGASNFRIESIGAWSSSTVPGIIFNTGSAANATIDAKTTFYSYYNSMLLNSNVEITSGTFTMSATSQYGVRGDGGFIINSGARLRIVATHILGSATFTKVVWRSRTAALFISKAGWAGWARVW